MFFYATLRRLMLTVKTFERPLASHPTFTYEPSRLPRKCHVSAFNRQLALPQRAARGVCNATTLDRQAVLSTQERVIRKVFEPVLTREVSWRAGYTTVCLGSWKLPQPLFDDCRSRRLSYRQCSMGFNSLSSTTSVHMLQSLWYTSSQS